MLDGNSGCHIPGVMASVRCDGVPVITQSAVRGIVDNGTDMVIYVCAASLFHRTLQRIVYVWLEEATEA